MLKQTDIVYLSGPMSGLPDYNVPAFNDAEKWLREHYSCKVLNPARHPEGLTYCEYMRRALTDLEAATVIVTLPRASDSIGASFEIVVAAEKLYKSIFFLNPRNELVPIWHGKECE